MKKIVITIITIFAVAVSVASFAESMKLASKTPDIVEPLEHMGDGQLALYNTHTGEKLDVVFRDGGKYDMDEIEKINHILRCRFTDKQTQMSRKLVELVDKIQDHFRGKEVHVISGFRHPEFNSYLRKTGHKVAKYSFHMDGIAIDIRVPGVSTKELRDYAASLKAGGVGYYPSQSFVHVDVGRVRYW
ncbi:DUF882 domain-containing protein [bacterium]|nr:DUF882 domain-containing protein [bacterium]